ncbi:MAG: hypothetical protein KJO07_01575 [Deltaproteobacteria bacterium]|jgi:hypothetical protein|nr:hypothetical protein [Deltaproteobacteria bacterium]
MPRIDDFESVFRSAIKKRFEFAAPAIRKALFLCDQSADDTEFLRKKVHDFISGIHGDDVEWVVMAGPDFDTVGEILGKLDEVEPDLVACFRHVVGRGKGLRYSLGSAVDTLTQETKVPILLLPDLQSEDFDSRFDGTERVLVVTDHLTGDDRLVNWGATFCAEGGTLYLAHVEDSATFERYAEAISKLPNLDSETVPERIRAKLLQLPTDYIATVEGVLVDNGFNETIEPVVLMGHAVSDYRKLIDDRDVQLVVMNTKDEDQSAMHGMAYALAIEVRERPLLLL